MLGRGGFCVVNEISKISLQDGSSNATGSSQVLKNRDPFTLSAEDIVQDRDFIASHYIRNGKNYRYALKQLQSSVRKDPQLYVQSVMDLVIETRYLAVLRHPHIIKMRAMSTGSPFETGNPQFVVLDKLYDILSTRLKTTWKQRLPGPMARVTDLRGKRAHKFWIERLMVAYDLTTALKYMHEERVMYRDLKPENIGFDVRGDVKIFDFGLAREFEPSGETLNPLLTGDTGSPRYMAPEVALNQPYNEKCDVYSFSILLWEILVVEPPFAHYTSRKQLVQKVAQLGARPKVDDSWPSKLIDLLREGWHADIGKRPSFLKLGNVLRTILHTESGEHRETVSDISGRSEIFRLTHNQRQAILAD